MTCFTCGGPADLHVQVTHFDADRQPVCSTIVEWCERCRDQTNRADQHRGEVAVVRDRTRIDEMTPLERLARWESFDANCSETGMV